MSLSRKRARGIYYNNADSSIASDNVKGALDEVDAAIVAEDLWDRNVDQLIPHNAGDDVNLLSGGLKDENVSSAVKLGSATDTSLDTLKKDILGSINELNVKIVNSVTDYGAVGDGVADDTVAFQDAVDAVDTVIVKEDKKYIINTGIVFIPAGIYKITDQITIPAGILVIGESRGSVLINHEPATTKNCFYFQDDVTFGNSIASQISNMSIQGDGANSQYGIAGENLSFNCIIEKVGVFGFIDGIYLDGAVTTTVRDSTCSDNSQYGLNLLNPSVANINNNRFEDNSIGCHITNVVAFPFVGGMKYNHNAHQRNLLEGLKIENWTDGVISDNDFEKNNVSATPDTAYIDIIGRFNQDINISCRLVNNRLFEDVPSNESIPIRITNIKTPIFDSNTFEGNFKRGITIGGIQESLYADNVVRGDYNPYFKNNIFQRRVDGSTPTTLDFFGAPTIQLKKTEPGVDFPGGTNDNISFDSAMTLNTSLSIVTPKFLVPDVAPANYQGIMAVSDRYSDVFDANTIVIRMNSSGAGGGLDFLLYDSTATLYSITAYSDFVEDFAGKYVRITATIDRSTSPATLKVYIDDVAVYENQSADWASDITPDYTHLGLGGADTSTYLGTMIGGAYIFKAALTSEEIQEFYNNNEEWSVYSTSPEFYAPLDEYADTVVKDQSGNVYNGVLLNNVSWNSEYKRIQDNAVHKTGNESIAGVKEFTDKVVVGTSEVSSSGNDLLIENTSATGNIIKKLADSAGVTEEQLKNALDEVVSSVDSLGNAKHAIGQTTVIAVSRADGTETAKINSDGDTVFNGGNVALGAAFANAQLDLQGSMIMKSVQATSDTDYTVLSTDFHIESFPATKTIYDELPPLVSAAKDRELLVTNGGSAGQSLQARANGSDTFFGGSGTSSAITDGSTIHVKNMGTYWLEY